MMPALLDLPPDSEHLKHVCDNKLTAVLDSGSAF